MASISKIIYSNRKTLALEINQNAELLVRSPVAYSKAKIDKFILDKQVWINKNIAKIKQRPQQNRQYQEGKMLLYLGKKYPIKITDTGYFFFDGKTFHLPNSAKHEAEKIVLFWYKNAFRDYAIPQLNNFAKQHALPFNKVFLKRQKTRWGSCSGINNINLNYLLIQAPMPVIDSVLLHELTHIIHKNHSKDFYQKLLSISPDYKIHQQWLKQNGNLLGFN